MENYKKILQDFMDFCKKFAKTGEDFKLVTVGLYQNMFFWERCLDFYDEMRKCGISVEEERLTENEAVIKIVTPTEEFRFEVTQIYYPMYFSKACIEATGSWHDGIRLFERNFGFQDKYAFYNDETREIPHILVAKNRGFCVTPICSLRMDDFRDVIKIKYEGFDTTPCIDEVLERIEERGFRNVQDVFNYMVS